MNDELAYLRKLTELQESVIRAQRACLKLRKREEALESFEEEEPAEGDVFLLVI